MVIQVGSLQPMGVPNGLGLRGTGSGGKDLFIYFALFLFGVFCLFVLQFCK